MIGTAAALLGSAAIGAGASIFGSSQAANAQKDAANAAINAQTAQYAQMRRDLMPYQNAGLENLQTLQQDMPYLTSEIQPLSAEGLQNLPGYQFTLGQGLRGAQNALTASGLGNSGAAVKAASRFSSGLADSTYMNQANYVTNLQLANRANTFNRLMSLVQSGQNAAAGTGAAGITTGQGVANSLIGAGNAQGAAYIAGGNAVSNAANNIGGYAMLNQLLSRGGGGMYANAADAGGGGIGSGGFNFLDAAAP